MTGLPMPCDPCPSSPPSSLHFFYPLFSSLCQSVVSHTLAAHCVKKSELSWHPALNLDLTLAGSPSATPDLPHQPIFF